MVRTEAFDAMAAGERELAAGVWQETDLLLWKPPAAWFSVNAFFVPDRGGGRRLRNWYVNFEHPARRTTTGFDTLDLTVDLVVAPDLTGWEWKDEDEYAHVRRLDIVSDTEHRAVDAARGEVLAMLTARSGRLRAGGAAGGGGGGGRGRGPPPAPRRGGAARGRAPDRARRPV
ncbi:DUF402 domain-containing protein, partial [Streptomyces sp. NPDC059131]|uniref:DUF402 domain-containing protein n=1 Tax=Streptomyces sp. NPDC059131 TaxID=3346736 RepID=UPI00369DB2A3